MMEPSDFLTSSEVRQILGGISQKSLDRWREKHWTEGIHYVQPGHRVIYIKPMIIDWMLHWKTNPMAHQLAKEEWLVKNQPSRKRRSAG
jgi:hypothetical protein